MKTKGSSIWSFAAMAMAVIFMTSCGNSQKRNERKIERQVTEQSVPVGTIVESETVVVEVDNLSTDSATIKKNVNINTPKKMK